MTNNRLQAGWLTDATKSMLRFVGILIASLIALAACFLLFYFYCYGIFPYYIRPTGELALVVFNPSASVRSFNDGLAAITAESGAARRLKSGFIKSDGTIVIPLEYDSVGDFKNGQARVVKDNKELWINSRGKIVYALPPEFRVVEFWSQPGFRILQRCSDNLVGAVDETGKKILIPFNFSMLRRISENSILFRDPHSLKWGCMNHEGRILVNAKFQHVSLSSWALAGASTKESGVEKWGLIDDSGAFIIIEPKFLSLKVISPDLYAVKTFASPDCISIVNRSGRVVKRLYPEIVSMSEFHAGLAMVCDSNGKYGYIDSDWQLRIPPQFWRAEDFDDSAKLARVFYPDDLSQETVQEMNFIDTSGKLLLHPAKRDVTRFLNGLAGINPRPAN